MLCRILLRVAVHLKHAQAAAHTAELRNVYGRLLDVDCLLVQQLSPCSSTQAFTAPTWGVMRPLPMQPSSELLMAASLICTACWCNSCPSALRITLHAMPGLHAGRSRSRPRTQLSRQVHEEMCQPAC